MTNTNKPGGMTIFLDLDGTVVHHNYDPDSVPDQPLVRCIRDLALFISRQQHPCVLIITTGRSSAHAYQSIRLLHSYKIFPDLIIHSLPVGQRILINDSNSDAITARALCVARNQDEPFLTT